VKINTDYAEGEWRDYYESWEEEIGKRIQEFNEEEENK
jgi:hypothetical protein